MKRKQIRRLLFLIIVMFMALDGMRSNIIGNEYISPIKELCILLLFYEAVKIKKNHMPYTKILGKIFGWLMFYHVILSLYSIFADDGTPLSECVLVCYKFSQVFLLSCCFYYYRELTGYEYNYLLRTFVYCCLVHAGLNFISLAVPLPIWEVNETWFGRFGKGYPTSDTASLGMALASILFLDLGFNLKKKVIFCFIVIIDVAMQVTGSSLFIIPAILLLSLIYGLWNRKSENLKLFFITSTIIILSFSSILIFIKKNDPERFDDATIVLEAKVDNFIKGEETDNFDSKRARKEQFHNACTTYHTSLSNVIFGAGIQHFSLRPSVLRKYDACHIENMFYVMYVIYGIVGFSLFLLFFITFLIKILLSKLRPNEKFFLWSLIGITMVSSSALISFYLIQIFGILSFSIGYYGAKKNAYSNRLPHVG